MNHRSLRVVVWSTAMVFVVLAAVRLWPRPPLRDQYRFSASVWSQDGRLLRVTRADDDQFRVWTPVARIAPTAVEAFLLKEDRWFYWTPGVNPVSLTRAAVRTARGSRQGGSTITMQLARLTYRMNTRSVRGKLRQMAAALWLEARYSKDEILEAYLNVVPLGANIQGVGAASVIYFDTSPDRLSLAQALTLAVIPQRPSIRAGRRPDESDLVSARRELGTLWRQRHPDRQDDSRQIALDIIARPPASLPSRAPHFVDAVLAADRGASGRIDTTLDAGLQQIVEHQIAQYVDRHGQRGIRNVAALLLDSRDLAVKAWVGSADFWSEAIDGQVNGVTAKRSPGSTLKPFVYALALDQGILHPHTMLRDTPTSFGPFSPENFDGRFFGPVSAEEALIRSRNIPAVWAASQLSQPSLYQFLQSAGVRDLKSESFYGLALPLGGGELTMEELATLYAMLANGGTLRPIRTRPNDPRDEGVSLISPEAAFITLDMLQKNPRPDDDGTAPVRTRWPVAWKTGTSWGFRDAWSAGIVGPYVLVIWIGDFEGRGNPAFVGVDAAAPLFFQIVDALNRARMKEPYEMMAPPSGVAKVNVCADSGDLPNVHCTRTVETWYIPGKSPIRVSQLHHAVAIDPRSGRAVCPPYPADTRFEVFEFWPSDMLELFRKAGMPRRVPPELPDCATTTIADDPRIASPLRGVTYALRRAKQEAIQLEASFATDVRRVYWFDGAALIASHPVSAGPLAWKPVSPGVHLLRIVDDHGRSAARDVEITFAN